MTHVYAQGKHVTALFVKVLREGERMQLNAGENKIKINIAL